ncbi:hypothetical protein [Rhizobium leguminosarum]|uniref:hypothetical protein n=1 Tax=Rhizobium leguminosarum TaxID=384 RepID=UPI00038286DC|nr:hypothetical protein [Rhizobium leguminosarum]
MTHLGRLFAIPLIGLAVQFGSVRLGFQDAYTSQTNVFAVTSGSLSARLTLPGDAALFDDLVLKWNGDYSWGPATGGSDPVTRFGDEARSVFGPIPDGACAGPQSRSLGLEVDGNSVGVEPNVAKPGSPLEFAHREAGGQIVKWTSAVAKCDKPSLAGGVTFCGLNSRIARVKRNRVEWLFLCRKSSDDLEVHAQPYWTQTDPRFSRYSAIGYNEITGEIAFIDGRKDRGVFDWSERFPPPGGQSYQDEMGRREAEELYDKTFEVNCVSCHDNKKPAIIDPHMQQARVGFSGDRHDARTTAFSLGSFFPGRVANVDAPFRVIGSGYAFAHRGAMRNANAFAIKGHPCFACHSLTTLESGRRFAADATGMSPKVRDPTIGQTVAIAQEKAALQMVRDHRTKWASEFGEGGIMPWMLPNHGGRLSEGSGQLSASEWEQLSACAWGSGGDICGFRPLFTSCPIPGESIDTFVPFDFSVASQPTVNGNEHSAIRLTWRYLNGYGAVPERDDVRFDVALKLEDIPSSRVSPDISDYPGVDESKSAIALGPGVVVSRTAENYLLIRNVSFEGHRRWTDAPATSETRRYSIAIPDVCGKRYLFRILPKRFCFENSGVVSGKRDYLAFYDSGCGE